MTMFDSNEQKIPIPFRIPKVVSNWAKTLAGFVVAFVPTWLIVLAQYLPAKLGFGIYLLGALQLVGLWYFLVFCYEVWKRPRYH